MNGRSRQIKALSLDGRGLGEGEISQKSAKRPVFRAILIAALTLAVTAPARADTLTVPDLLKGFARLAKLHDLRNVDAVSKALGLDFVITTQEPLTISLKAKPDWLTSVNYTRYGVQPDKRVFILGLRLAPSAGCVKTEQVAAELGHDYKLTPFQTTTQMGPGKIDAQLQYLITYTYPGEPPFKITLQPDHDHSGCFRSISADSIPPK